MIMIDHTNIGDELVHEIKRFALRHGICHVSIKGPTVYLSAHFEIGRDSENGAGSFTGISSSRQIKQGLFEAMAAAQGECRR